MPHFDLCLAWNWEYDRDFVRLLENACAQRGLSFFSVTPGNLDATLAALDQAELSFGVFFDRASESDPHFQPLVEAAQRLNIFQVNPQALARWSVDKATMHQEFMRRGVETPATLLLPSCTEQPELPALDLSSLGGCFAIKPASLGGGEGVVLQASTLEQVQSARWQFPLEKYLLQAHIAPQVLEGRPAWFRLLVCGGAVYACWWDQLTHIYTPLLAEQRMRFGLRSLYELARRVSQVCRLELFSSEIALAADGRFLVVDYVNEPVDLRLQSTAMDGVPDVFVERICGRLARLVEDRRLISSKRT